MSRTTDEPATWVRSYSSGFDYLEHIDGVSWGDSPKPRRWHRCRAQTRGDMGRGLVERCACGATRLAGHSPWMERNSRH